MTYTADDYSGYVAKVTYDGYAKYPDVTPYSKPGANGPVYSAGSKAQPSSNYKTESSYKSPGSYKVPVSPAKSSQYGNSEEKYKQVSPISSSSSNKESIKSEYSQKPVEEYNEPSKATKYEVKPDSSNYKEPVVSYKDKERVEYKKPTETVYTETKKTQESVVYSQPEVVKTVKIEPALVYNSETSAPKKIAAVPVVYKPETLKNPEPTTVYKTAAESTKKSPWTPVYNPPPAVPIVGPALYRPVAPPVYRPTAPAPAIYPAPVNSAYGISTPSAPARYRVVPAASYRPNVVTNYPVPAAYRLLRKPPTSGSAY